jgi:2-methylcitrate dehydratase PrpD
LFGRDRVSGGHVLAGLGTDYQVGKIVFKKYPSCGATQASTEMILDLAAGEGFGAADVERVDITVPPYIYKLVGHPFQVGSNPKVNAQFNIRYCVANALVRGGSKLAHFEVEAIKDSEVLEVVKKVEVVPDPAMDARGHTAVDMRVTTKDGRQYLGQTDVAPGFPECPLSKEEHLRRFRECVRFAAKPFPDDRADKIVEAVDHLDESKDVSSLIALLLPT